MNETLTTVAPAGWASLTGECKNSATIRAACFHCGEACPDHSFVRDEKSFCCQGCLVVHDLLSENGLEHFYALTRHPGVSMRRAASLERWTFLDEPTTQQRLLDFTDGIQSRITFHIPSIHCVACVWLLENLFRLHPGIGRSQVDFPQRQVAISFATQKLKLSELVALLASIGYEPTLTFGELDKRSTASVLKRRWLQIGVAGFAFGNIMLFSLPQYFGLDPFSGPALKTLFGWISLALALPVVVFSAADYWNSAWVSLRERVATLDIPIAIGLAVIYGQSAYEIISRTGEGYFDSLCGLIFFLLCGRAFQQKTQERIAFDRDYKSFFPLSVVRKANAESGASEERVALSQLEIGDRVIIRHGEIIPADSRLISRDARVDYSFVTGESEPIAKTAGDYLYAGGQQTGGAIEIETLKAVSQSYLASLWNHEAFQKQRDDSLNTLTNRYSRRFIWIVISVALAALGFWIFAGEAARGLKAFTSVLIVACPCALALAAPFTLGTAQRWLAKANVFLKNVFVLERLAKVDAIVFDKTGTLTTAGACTVRFEGALLNADERIGIASLTGQSTHPHSARIHEAFHSSCTNPVRNFSETIGRGIEGEVNGHMFWIGSRAWLKSRGATGLDSEVSNKAFRANGSRVELAINGKFRGSFLISSALRAEVDRLIRELGANYELALLSGDNEREREEFAELFGSHARLNFNQSPLDKLGFIRRLQDSGKIVMMIGDGLNDAGALKQSDVGVAVVEKVGAFSPASDVILEADRVTELSRLLKFARRATRIVGISFAISSVYNVIGIGIAAAGWLSPVVCAVLMPLSSASVVLFACGVTAWTARRLFSGSEIFNPQSSRS